MTKMSNKLVDRMTPEKKLKKILDSPKLYIENFIKIVDKNGNIIPFKFNEQQEYFDKHHEKFNIILKSRQLGFSTYCMAKCLYIALTKPYSTCLMMSYSIDSATGIFEKLKQQYDFIPEVLKPKRVVNNKKELKFTNGSRIIVSTAGSKEVGRGLSLDYVHMSELAFMKNSTKQLLAIEQALKPNAVCTIESTANGLNSFYDLCQASKNGENTYKYFFFKWYDDKVMFHADYKNKVKSWLINHEMLTYADCSEREKQLVDDGATIDQIIWRRMKIANAGSEESFLQEFPEDDITCFVSTGASIFDNLKIIERVKWLPKPLAKTELRDLTDNLQLQLGKFLSIWKTPEPNQRYFLGVDTGEGIGKDYSVIEVVDLNGEQVAEYRNNKIEPHRFAQLVNELGTYYNNGHLVVEKASAGHTVVDKLKNEYCYVNMHKAKMYDERGRVRKKVGFETNSKTKPLIINQLREGFSEGQILINSKTTLEEMKTFVSNGNSMGAVTGSHDDTVMALAMAIYGANKNIYYSS